MRKKHTEAAQLFIHDFNKQQTRSDVAMEVSVPLLRRLWLTDRLTDQLTNQRTWWFIGKLHFNKDSYEEVDEERKIM